MLDCIAPGPDDIVLPKTSSSVFISTNLDYLLRCLGKRQARAHSAPAPDPAERHVPQHLDLLACCRACASLHKRMSRSHAVEVVKSIGGAQPSFNGLNLNLKLILNLNLNEVGGRWCWRAR